MHKQTWELWNLANYCTPTIFTTLWNCVLVLDLLWITILALWPSFWYCTIWVQLDQCSLSSMHVIKKKIIEIINLSLRLGQHSMPLLPELARQQRNEPKEDGGERNSTMVRNSDVVVAMYQENGRATPEMLSATTYTNTEPSTSMDLVGLGFTSL